MGSGADASTEELLKERGANYGPPIDHFACTQTMYEVWLERRMKAKFVPNDKEYAVRHGVYMILDKIARAAENPNHLDNWDDIKGYAECVKKLLQDAK